jgi:hypothetical protein|tara:strand:- start:714 stop:905 length:192 start_codon:yes stop_codon:yes gene_type:complete
MFNIEELTVIQQALNSLTIQGSNAKYLALLQDKILSQIKKLQEEAIKKEQGRQEIINKEKNKK